MYRRFRCCSFVTEALGSAFSDTLVQLFSRHDEAVFDYLDFRRDMEGLAAERAATRGTESDLKVIDALFAQMEAAHGRRNPADEARLDADFHLAIIEASHNVMMLHMMRSMYQLLREGAKKRLKSFSLTSLLAFGSNGYLPAIVR